MRTFNGGVGNPGKLLPIRTLALGKADKQRELILPFR